MVEQVTSAPRLDLCEKHWGYEMILNEGKNGDCLICDRDSDIFKLRKVVDDEGKNVLRLRDNIERLYKTLGAQSGSCKACDAPIWWVTTKNGKSAPFTAEGLNHFADCPKAEQFRKKKKT